ncbi:MAG: MFS transporter [Selenomonadaceae bacterium]|nr:MFS transporter [Selenomonadaceae bacterium]
MNERNENIRYSLLVSLNTMMMCTGFSFITYYLLDAQISDKNIGLLIAISCTVAIFLQQLFGRMVDNGVADGKKVLLIIAAVMSIAAGVVLFIDSGIVKALIFGLLACLTLAMQPVLNSFTFFYQSKGLSVNYGVARGFGSLSFAVASVVIGFLTVHFGSLIVSLSYLIFCAVFYYVTMTMPAIGVTSRSRTSNSLQLGKFPAFMWMLIGLSLIMLFHNMVMTYFIHVVERVGGDSSNMGVALGIAAIIEIPVLFLYTRMKEHISSKVFLTVSGIAFFTRAALLVFSQSILEIYLIQCIQLLDYGLMAASRVYYVDETVGKKYEATGQAYMTATETVGIVLGSTLGGFLMQGSGIDTLLTVGAVICFVGMLCMIYACQRRGNG